MEWEPGLVARGVGPVEAPARSYKQPQGKPGSTSCWFYDASSPLLACDLVNKQPPTMFRRRLLHRWQTVCKPGSVGLLAQSGRSFLYEHGRPCSLAAYPRCLDRGGRLSPHIWPCSSRGLPCRSCHHERGGLLPHRFTLATRRWRSLFCGTVRHGKLALSVPRRYLAACPLEPGLSSNRYHKDTNARPSDRLLLQI